MVVTRRKVDTPRGVTRGGGGTSGPLPELHDRVVSGDRNTGDPRDPKKRRGGGGGQRAGKKPAKR